MHYPRLSSAFVLTARLSAKHTAPYSQLYLCMLKMADPACAVPAILENRLRQAKAGKA